MSAVAVALLEQGTPRSAEITATCTAPIDVFIGHSWEYTDRSSDEKPLEPAPEERRTAFDGLYRQYYSYVFSLASRILGCRLDAEEVTQEVFLELWLHPPEARFGAPSMLAWLAITTKTRCWGMLRRSRRTPQCEPLVGDFVFWDSAFEVVLGNQLRAQLEAAFPSVPDDYRSILWLTYHHDMGPTEIAGHLGLPVITVRRRLKTIIKKLQRTLSGPLVAVEC
jgi:RNA polymerase sigma-70 factor (ECF subfamily)